MGIGYNWGKDEDAISRGVLEQIQQRLSRLEAEVARLREAIAKEGK